MSVKDKSFALILVALFLASLVTLPYPSAKAESTSDDWSMFGHDSTHSGFSTSTVPTTPVLVWSYPSPKISSIDKYHQSGIHYAPTVADGYLYIDRGLSCLNTSTGQLVWSNGLGTGFESPAVADGVVYAGTYGLVSAFNGSTGALIWNTSFTNKYGNQDSGGSPVVSNDVVYIQGYNDLYALNGTDGGLIWKYAISGSWYTSISPAISDGLVFSASFDGIFALKASNGVKVWSFSIDVVTSSPVVYNGVVYVGSSDNNLYALNAQTGKVVWKYSTGSRITATPSVAKGTVYVGSWDGSMYALDSANGSKMWSFKAGAEIESAAAIADGLLFTNCNDRYLYALNATTGEFLWKYLTISSSDKEAAYDGDAYENAFTAAPVIAEGKIYVGTVESNVLAFGDVSETVQTPNFTFAPTLWIAFAITIVAVAFILVTAGFWVYRKKHKAV
jgi:outer membrane protein assembly factor BamB